MFKNQNRVKNDLEEKLLFTTHFWSHEKKLLSKFKRWQLPRGQETARKEINREKKKEKKRRKKEKNRDLINTFSRLSIKILSL